MGIVSETGLMCHSPFIFSLFYFNYFNIWVQYTSLKNLPLPYQDASCFQTVLLMKYFLTSKVFSDTEKNTFEILSLIAGELMESPLGFGVTAVFMGSIRWKLNWHFYAHALHQMLGRTRCWSCFLPASPTRECNIKHAHWGCWKLLALSPEDLGDVHNY